MAYGKEDFSTPQQLETGLVPTPRTRSAPTLLVSHKDVLPATELILSKGILSTKRKVGLNDFNSWLAWGRATSAKSCLLRRNQCVISIRSEKHVFLAVAHGCHLSLLGLYSCLQTETWTYFVMEYVSGGDLMLHLQCKQSSLRQAKFYALADYGLQREYQCFDLTTSTFCGTPNFMVPEILLAGHYDCTVDCHSPFRGDDEDKNFDVILEDELLYRITTSRDAVSILQKNGVADTSNFNEES
ncbi:hypothetical protein SCLCIDRAFT_12030 [Scleroderma citrinum Foug A]|uniref:non-specific serine/threonine protein kinase n=1 Tax=Scleroderma citrinum Foug A TaxID=1036808 RepID=A0A0C2ZFY9_9AGAM|nr:hypothetical protein SCLCIDRAFT_12030 [Scleroderma citrinum Foug A]